MGYSNHEVAVSHIGIIIDFTDRENYIFCNGNKWYNEKHNVPFADTNRNLKRYRMPNKNGVKDSLWQLLMGVRAAGLENDSLLDIFYEVMADKYQSDQEYGVFIYHDRYDIPSKAADHKRLGESVQFFEYLICAVCRVSGDYEPEKPECGFLFPAYSQGGALVNCIDIFQDNELYPHTEFAEMLLE